MGDNKLFIYNIISNISKLILFINVFFYFKSYKKKSIAFKVFAFYILFILIIQIITYYLRLYKINNLYLSHYYFVGQFLFLSVFYFFLEKNKTIKKIITIATITILFFIGIYYIKNPLAYFEFNIYEIVATAIPLIAYSFYFFIKKIDSEDKKYIYLNSGFFIYITCSTLIFSAGNIKNASLKHIIWYSNVVLYLIYQILILVEWYKNFRKPLKPI
jgi:hypothetical protein